MYKYNQIKEEYGEEVLKNVRKYEKLSKIQGRYTSHLRFNLQCKHVDIIPKSIKISSQINTQEARIIIHKAEKALLNIRITETAKKKRSIEENRSKLQQELKEKISQTIYEQIEKKGEKYRIEELEKYSERQKKKYYKLRYGTINKPNQERQPQTNNGRGDEAHEVEENNESEVARQQDNRGVQNNNNGDKDVDTVEENVKERWVKNLSKRVLSDVEKEVLLKGAGFAIAPSKIPYEEYIVATELACKNLPRGQAAALKAEITEVLCRAKLPKSNITKGERSALFNLREDKSIVVVPADKGKCLVVMDRDDYIRKMETKLNDITTYKQINKDPTNEIKEALSKQLNNIKEKGEMDQKGYLKLLPSKLQIPRMYGQPKIHKPGFPMREIVDSTGGVTKDIDSYISKIFKTYIGKGNQFVKNSKHFVSMIEGLRVEEGEILVSYDVTALYPSIPQNEAIDIMYLLMKEDENLKEKTKMSAESIRDLFMTCVRKTYFTFNKKLYVQVNGLAIGAATSGFAAEVFMESFERKALSTFAEPPGIWKRYVDDTFTKLKINNIESFLIHLNSQHERIKFTSEEQKNNRLAFLDTEIHVKEDGTTKVTIFRKSTHTDQYLHFSSNHHIKQKMGIISTFRHRINTIITEEEDRKKEEDHVEKALKRCGHPEWAIKKRRKQDKKEVIEPYGKVVVPYISKLSENIARTFRKYNIETIHKPTRTIKNTVCTRMKDKIHELDQAGVVYNIECKKHKTEYVGETERVLRTRLYEHKVISHKEASTSHSIEKEGEEENRREESGNRRSNRRKEAVNYKKMHTGSQIILTEGNTEVSCHIAHTEHSEEDIEYKIIGREANWYKRGIKEAIAIKEKKPKLNKDDGRYRLSAIYDNVLEMKKRRHCSTKSGDNGLMHQQKIQKPTEEAV